MLIAIPRLAYAAAILWGALAGKFALVALNLPVFLGTLPLFLLGRKRKDLALADGVLMGIFAIFLATYLFEPSLVATTGEPLGIDKLFHVAGGFGAGMLALFFYSGHIKDKRVLIVASILSALAIGAAWEVFEWIASMLPEVIALPAQGMQDTMLDLAADTLGAALAALALHQRHI